MITHIQGKLVEKNPTDVVIECNGVGYFINISLTTYSQIPNQENIKLFTHHYVREDVQALYGFFQKSERAVFRLLISVSGIGTNTARTMLSSLTSEKICEAIGAADVATIQSVKGIGAKTAQRVIIELKDKVLKLYDLEEVSMSQSNTNKEETLSALEVLGFARKQSERILDKIIKEMPNGSVEELIKLALKNL
ncbi:Holliday junction branch migration protein RuvA [Kordia sp.]|uniref:Holliday junction branch migration protein RuvA n=1 Tax=Kordia sp. TaxID=1965332 RepID=UPI003D2D5B8B